MIPSASLIMLSLALQDALAIAARPGATAPEYRPAVRACVTLARQMFREYEAMHWREHLRASVEATARYRTSSAYVEPKKNYTGGPGYWTGD